MSRCLSFCHFYELLRFERLTYATWKLITSLTKSFFNDFFNSKVKKNNFSFFCIKNLSYFTIFHFKIKVSLEWSNYETNLMIKATPLMTYNLISLERKCPYNDFLAKESLMVMLSDGSKIMFNSSVLFSRKQLLFEYTFLRNTLYFRAEMLSHYFLAISMASALETSYFP